MSPAIWIGLYVVAGVLWGFANMQSHTYRRAEEMMGNQPMAQLGFLIGFLFSVVIWPLLLAAYLYVLLFRRP